MNTLNDKTPELAELSFRKLLHNTYTFLFTNKFYYYINNAGVLKSGSSKYV